MKMLFDQKKETSKFSYATARGAAGHWEVWITDCAVVKREEVDAETESFPSGTCALLLRATVSNTKVD